MPASCSLNTISIIKKRFKTSYIILINVIIICIVFSACNSNKKPSTELPVNGIEINIDDYNPDDVVYYSELFDDYEIIPLETKKECLMGRINSVRFCRDHIVILESRQSKSVFLFDMNGKFVRKIAKEGKGPGEYIQVDAISTDEETGEIAIFDGMANQILLYKIDGSYIKTIPLNVKSAPRSIELFNNKIFVSYATAPEIEYLLNVIDKKGNIIVRLIPNENINNYSDPELNSPSTIFFRKDNKLKFRCSSINTLFNIENNSVQPLIHLTSQKLKAKSELAVSSGIEDFKITPKKFDINNLEDGTYNFYSYIEANNVSIFESKNGFVYTLFLYDTKSGLIKSVNLRNFKDDLMNREGSASGYFLTIYKDKLVAAINSGLLFNELLEKIETGDLTSEKHNLKELNENSNPCIIMYKCKPEIVLND